MNIEALNDKEFEELARDLLQAEMNITFESFKKGRDKGIDLRYSKSNNSPNTIIVQAKHYYKSGYSLLLYHLKKKEVDKVIKLKPERYIFITSVGLSPDNKTEILNIFSPFIKSTADIYGYDDIENLLNKNKKIFKQHIKLYLSSIETLSIILHNAIEGRSEFAKEQILKNNRIFVPHSNISNAINILNEENFLLIIGEAGIGKTLLAKHLVVRYLAEGFKLIYVIDNIREAEDLFYKDDKQIIYFDDFLGSSYSEIKQSKNSDSALLLLIERIRNTKNKRLIITSRTTYVNQAQKQFPRLKNPSINFSKHQLNVDDYSDLERAKILYNHLFHSDLPHDYQQKIFDDKNYFKIIKHKSFNPRLIEFITDFRRLRNISPEDYLSYIVNKLESPDDIWEEAYENDIDDYSRFLLSSMFTLHTDKISHSVDEKLLQKAYDARLEYEIFKNGFVRISNPFYSKVKELLDGFIKRQIKDDLKTDYKFFNPAFTDFLIKYLDKNSDEKWRILNSIIYFDQFERQFGYSQLIAGKKVKFTKEELPQLQDLLEKKKNILISISDKNIKLSLLYQFVSFFKIDDICDITKELYSEIKFDKIIFGQYQELYHIVTVFEKESSLKQIIINDWKTIILKLFEIAWSDDEFTDIVNLFGTYNFDYSEFIENDSNKETITNCIEEYLFETVDEYVKGSVSISDYHNENDLYHEIDKVADEISDFVDIFEIEYPDDLIDYGKFWSEAIDSWSDGDDYHYNYSGSKSINYVTDEQLIDNLFDR